MIAFHAFCPHELNPGSSVTIFHSNLDLFAEITMGTSKLHSLAFHKTAGVPEGRACLFVHV